MGSRSGLPPPPPPAPRRKRIFTIHLDMIDTERGTHKISTEGTFADPLQAVEEADAVVARLLGRQPELREWDTGRSGLRRYVVRVGDSGVVCCFVCWREVEGEFVGGRRGKMKEEEEDDAEDNEGDEDDEGEEIDVGEVAEVDIKVEEGKHATETADVEGEVRSEDLEKGGAHGRKRSREA